MTAAFPTALVDVDRAQVAAALAWDHERLDRLEHAAFDAWAAGDVAGARTAFERFARGLRRHIGLEEALVFPELDRRLATGAAPEPETAALRAEHRQILALVAAIELAVRSNAVPIGLLRRHLRDLLTAHNRKEEQVLYPLADRLLRQDERGEIVRRIELPER